ncbi:MAG: nucleotidyl transferase AbiEii/AbiGii toxin family protein [Candidatus Xenobia bacterium]
MVDLNEFIRLFQALEREGAEYVLVGGLAMFAQGLPRETKDIDLFVRVSPENAERVRRALDSVYHDPSIAEIDAYEGVIRYGPPVGDYLIDILGSLGEVWRFEDLEWEPVDVAGVTVRVATPRTLYRMKHATVRPQDHVDAAALAQKFGLEE